MQRNIFTMHSAASATANGPELDCEDYSVAAFQLTGTFAATITFEGTIDNTNWVAIEAINIATGGKATTATAAGVYRMGIGSLLKVRARLTWSSGTSITVTGILTNAADPMIQDVALAANSGVDIGDMDVLSIAAGETHVGEIGTASIGVTNTPGITAGLYTILDIVGGVQALANTQRVSGEASILQSVVIRDKAAQNQAMTLFFFNANPTNGTYTNDIALTIHDTDLAMCIGAVRVLAADYTPASASSVATVANIGLQLRSAATGLWVIAQCTGTAPTYASTSDLAFVYEFQPD